MISTIKNQYDDFWNKRSRTYLHKPLQGDEPETDDDAYLREKEMLRAHSRGKSYGSPCMILMMITFLVVWTFLMSLVFRYQHGQSSCIQGPPKDMEIFSPMEEAVEWVQYRFNAGLFGQKTEYMGQPNKVKDDMWLDIVEHGMVAIPAETALRVNNESGPWEEKPGYHMFGTEMYHQLHCLNTMRIALWKEVPDVMYGHEGEGGFEHMDHCIDYLRQTIICHGDIHLIPLAYDPALGHSHPSFDTVHTCKKYEPIVEWVDARQAGDVTPNGVGPPSGLHLKHDHDHHNPAE